MKIAYFDCFAGAGGDMIVASMLDAGLDQRFLLDQLASLKLPGIEISIEKTKRGGISAIRFAPKQTQEHHHRHLSDIENIIQNSSISKNAKKSAIAVFRRLGTVEAAIHEMDIKHVHFHEVGAVDSILDIVAACVGLDALGIEQVQCSTLSLGGGTVQCEHGIIPVPAPATALLLKEINAPVQGGPIDKELLTPTAAALLAEWSKAFGPLPPMSVEAIGYGAGTLDSDQFPNVLRLIIGNMAQNAEREQTDTVALLECNIDDATGEIIGDTLNRLLESGVLDAFTTPIGMKHSRPAVMLSVLCNPGMIEKTEQIIFESGVTLGIRRQLLHRSKLIRKILTVDTAYGPIRVKQGFLKNRRVTTKPEYRDCAAAAQQYNVSIKLVQQASIEVCKKEELDSKTNIHKQ
ncbi:MAG: nickel pincer cofactor biosynthesis protein LarC [Sedimentisphaerales bacterium]|nr:nickel pincer cofactor biosynthesis protein LarC [Sedimentisphaerales bacterium]